MFVGPVGHLAAERARLAGLRWDDFDVELVGATIGGEVSGVDLTRPLPDAVIAELRQALLDYKVLFFRDQPLTPAAARQRSPAGSASSRSTRSSRRTPTSPSWSASRSRPTSGATRTAGTTTSPGGPARRWAPCSTRSRCPPAGGDTLFADMYAAYDGLDPELQARLDGHGRGARLRQDVRPPRRPSPSVTRCERSTRRSSTRSSAPIPRPAAGCCSSTGSSWTTWSGSPADESTALIDGLSHQADTIEYQCRFRWAPHSVAFWDNRAVQHYAVSDYWPDVRVLERASVVGDRPR